MHKDLKSKIFPSTVGILLSLVLSLTLTGHLYAFDYTMAFRAPGYASNCTGLSGGEWVDVPGNSIYGTTPFCVQKYVPSNVSSVATSIAGSAYTPWVNISQTTAKTTCSALGSGYHLITNTEWMTVAANLANVASNWSGGSVGSGELTRGHSDNNPGAACAADADDSKGWVDGSCTGQVQGAQQFRERRTRTLSNGQVIWDIGGNVWQWVDAYDPNGKPGTATDAWNEYSTISNGTTNWPRSVFVPLNSAQPWWSDTWNSTQGIGQIFPSTNGSGGALYRGGHHGYSTEVGAFSASLWGAPSIWSAAVGFRCAFTPTTTPTYYTVTYNGNSNTSGSVPSDPLRYVAGDTVIVSRNISSLARTNYVFGGWNTAADGSGTTYMPWQTFNITDNTTLYAKWDAPLACNGLAGGTWVSVPGDSLYGTSNFCVQKYEASNVSGVATSQISTTGWNSIDQITAKTSCSALGSGYHLITNPEWMTIAANIANVSNNWSGGTVGNGTLSRGHSDNNPASACAANASDANAWVNTNCTGSIQGTQQFNQRRTQNLSNGSVIWDLAGNFWEWVDYSTNDKPTPAVNAYSEFTAITGSITTPKSHLVPINSLQSWWNDSWNSTQAIGQINPGTAGSGGVMIRGVSYDGVALTGIFGAALYFVPTNSSPGVGFRCTYSPPTPTYKVFYAANSATGGTAPGPTAYTNGQTVIVATNSGTLIRAGYVFNGWNTAADGSGWAYAAGSGTFTMGSADVTLYAKWIRASCSAWYQEGNTTNGIYQIDPGGTGSNINVYCDMTTSGGGWTLVAAQFESDQMTNWNEGIQADYDPSLATSKSFALNTAQIPAHTQMGVGKQLDPTFLTSFNYTYTTGNIARTSITGADGNGYLIHRNTSNYYDYHNPDATGGYNNSGWNNTLTIEGSTGAYSTAHDMTWAFSPQSSNAGYRGFGLRGQLVYSSQTYAWTIWVR